MAAVNKVTFWGIIVLPLLLVFGVGFTIGWQPLLGPRERPVTGRTFARTPERLARGRYIAETLAGCMHCHSLHDWSKRDAPILPGMEGAGDMFPVRGLPGRVVAPNLTPDPQTGLGNWTDDEIARAIREGVDRDGHTLFPMMPYEDFHHMSDEDLASVVVFLRSLPPVHHALPKSQIVFPVRYLMRSDPRPLTAPVPPPDMSTPQKRGAYLVTIAGCGGCHTPERNGQPIRGMEFGGGRIFAGPWGRVASANITPDPSGIDYYDQKMFVEALRTGQIGARRLNAIMPWSDFRHLTDEDLDDIFAYLKTIKPVHHRVDNTEKPTLCPLCGAVHGLGDEN